jgi:hypothetical protein
MKKTTNNQIKSEDKISCISIRLIIFNRKIKEIYTKTKIIRRAETLTKKISRNKIFKIK